MVFVPTFRAIPLQRCHCLNGALEQSKRKACPPNIPRQYKGMDIKFPLGEVTSLPKGNPRLQIWLLWFPTLHDRKVVGDSLMLTSAEQDKRKRLEAPIFALKQTKAFFIIQPTIKMKFKKSNNNSHNSHSSTQHTQKQKPNEQFALRFPDDGAECTVSTNDIKLGKVTDTAEAVLPSRGTSTAWRNGLTGTSRTAQYYPASEKKIHYQDYAVEGKIFCGHKFKSRETMKVLVTCSSFCAQPKLLQVHLSSLGVHTEIWRGPLHRQRNTQAFCRVLKCW